ncbi:MAG: hypothetical protein ACKVOB_03445 [Sphingomonas sp.]
MPMPLYKRDNPEDAAGPIAPPAPMGSVEAMGDTIDWVESPARLLHERLVASYSRQAHVADEHLPGATRIAIILGASSALWVLIGAIVLAIF